MKARKLWALLCMAAMLVTSTGGALAGEGNDGTYLSGTELYQQGISDYQYQAGELLKYDEQMHITVGRPIDFNATEFLAMAEVGEPPENNRWIQYYRDALNVDCEYTLTSTNSGDYDQQLLLAMSAGELPDVFTVFNLPMLNQLAEAGAIWDLTEVYQANANETLGKLLEREGTSIYGSSIVDGKLYAIPQKMPSTNSYNHCWVRRDWLEELGLEVPATMDDVKAIAQAFVDQYDDNIGLMFSNSYMYEYQGIFWAFGAGNNMNRNHWDTLEDGTVGYSEVQPGMKEGLRWLSEMHAAGLINPEWSTETTWDALANYVATNRCGIFFGPHWYGFSLQAYEETMDDAADWIPVGLPTGGEDVDIRVRANNTIDGWVCVNANMENPEVAIHMLNAYAEIQFGENNDFENYFACEQNSSLWKAGPVWALSATVDLDPCANMMEAYDAQTQTMDESKLEGAGRTYWTYIQEGISAYKYMFGPVDSCFVFVQETYPDIMVWNGYQGAPTKTQNERWSSMEELIDTYYLQMINGQMDIDTGFDEMVTKWNEIGGTAVTQEVNEKVAELQ